MNRFTLATLAFAIGVFFAGHQIAYPKIKIGAGNAGVRGLQLTLRADRREVELVDGKIANPATLKLTLVNVGDKAIKLNVHDFYWSRIRGDVKAMPEDSMQIQRVAADRIQQKVKPEDFPEIKPGETWSFSQGLTFPGALSQGGDMLAQYIVKKPGEFRIRVKYVSQALESPLAQGVWTGELESNEMVILAK